MSARTEGVNFRPRAIPVCLGCPHFVDRCSVLLYVTLPQGSCCTLYPLPFLRLRKGIRAISELRVKIEQASDAGWREAADSMGDEQFEWGTTEKRSALYNKSAEYDNKQFKEALLPEYEKMVSLFREKIHLAYPDTTEHFGELVEFVAIWKRHLDGSLLPEALPHIYHTEENVRPLYESLQRRYDELVEQIASAKPR